MGLAMNIMVFWVVIMCSPEKPDVSEGVESKLNKIPTVAGNKIVKTVSTLI
jgi:hypothetical protein